VKNRKAIAERWLECALRGYPRQTADFIAAEADPFRHPIGHTFREGLNTLLDELLRDEYTSRGAAALGSIMQIRAVQDVPPGDAVEFLFELKDILRDDLSGPDFAPFESRIDRMALAAFDIYMKYRERIWEARSNEARRRVHALEQRLQPRDETVWRNRGGA
jgi:hypothetical protein